MYVCTCSKRAIFVASENVELPNKRRFSEGFCLVTQTFKVCREAPGILCSEKYFCVSSMTPQRHSGLSEITYFTTLTFGLHIN